MITTFSHLLLYQLAGEILTRWFKWPIPAPVIGMLLFLLSLLMKGRIEKEIQIGANALLQHLSLLFIPVGVGVIVHLKHIGSEWLPISLAIILSTLAGLAVTALTLKALSKNPTKLPHE